MNKLYLISTSLSLLIGVNAVANDSFTLKSKAIENNRPIQMDHVFNSFGCTGKNISPDLEWSNPPAGTKSFAVTVYDPDAPTGSGWWHWTVFNLPADLRSLPAGAGSSPHKLPKGAIQGNTDFGKPGYGGPCPPPGSEPHHYHFKVFALKDRLPLNAHTPGAQVGYYIQQNKLAEAEITATFRR